MGKVATCVAMIPATPQPVDAIAARSRSVHDRSTPGMKSARWP
jgi:hypothetical protein